MGGARRFERRTTRTPSKPHTHTHTHTHSLSLSHTHTLPHSPQAAWTDAYACSLEKATLLPHSMLLPGGVPRYTAVNARRLLFVRAFAFAAAAAIAARWVL